MTSCAIIISHFESFNFLRTTVRQIRRYQHPYVRTEIIIADQSSKETYDEIVQEYCGYTDVTVVHTQPLWSGYGMDYCLRYLDIKTDYIAQLHTDCFPINRNYLYLCIKLIEEYNFAFVGQLHFISMGDSPIYPNNCPFFSMSPTFNVAKAETYKELSLHGGFTRFHNRNTDFHNKIPMDKPMTWDSNDWEVWAKEDYYSRGSDDDTVAFHWEDTYREHNKLGLAITGSIGLLGREPDFGRVIENIMFHFGSCRESINVLSQMGEQYRKYTQKIKEGYDDTLIEELLSLVKQNTSLSRNFWDGKLKKHFPTSDELNKRIEELKNK